MPGFSVKIDSLKNVESQFKDIQSCLDSALANVKKVSNTSLLGSSQSFVQIKKELNNTCADIIEYKNSVTKLEVSIEEIIGLYEKTERDILNNTDVVFVDLKEVNSEKEKNASSGYEGLKDRIREWLNKQSDSDAENDFKIWLKNFYKSNDVDGDGFIDSLLGYFNDIEDFLNWWANGDGDIAQGLAAVCDLSKTSSKLWSSFYEYISSQDATGIFRNQWGEKVAFVNICGSLMGMVSDAIDAVTDVTDNVWEKWSNIIDVLNGAVDVESSVAKFEAISTHSDTGPIKLWKTFANTILSTISQAFDSIGEHYADGIWDTNDTAETMLEAAVSGLDAEISGIISFLTLGTVDLDTLRRIYNIPTAEEASVMMEDWAHNKGEEIGNFILGDPKLADMAMNGNAYEKSLSYATGAIGVHMENTNKQHSFHDVQTVTIDGKAVAINNPRFVNGNNTSGNSGSNGGMGGR